MSYLLKNTEYPSAFCNLGGSHGSSSGERRQKPLGSFYFTGSETAVGAVTISMIDIRGPCRGVSKGPRPIVAVKLSRGAHGRMVSRTKPKKSLRLSETFHRRWHCLGPGHASPSWGHAPRSPERGWRPKGPLGRGPKINLDSRPRRFPNSPTDAYSAARNRSRGARCMGLLR